MTVARARLAFLGLAVVLLAAQLPSTKDTWVRLVDGDLTLLSNAGQRETLEAAHDLVALDSLLSGELAAGERSRKPTKAYVFKNKKSFAPYMLERGGDGRTPLKGFFLSRAHGNFVGVIGHTAIDGYGAVHHEWVHQFVAEHLARLPLWLAEGLAEYYSHFEVNAGQANVGRPKGEHINLLRSDGLIPIADFLSADSTSPYYNVEGHTGRFYAQSWLAVHFLLSKPSGFEQLNAFIARFGAGDSVETALLGVFGRSPEDLERDLDRYLFGQVFPSHWRDVDRARSAVPNRIETLGRADALAQLGDLLVHQLPPRTEAAIQHFESALELEPGLSLAHAGLGVAAEQRGDLAAALAHFRRAVELQPDEFAAQFLFGDLVIGAYSERFVTANALEPQERLMVAQARSALSNALELQPDHQGSLAALANSSLFLAELTEEDARVVERAAALVPDRADVIYSLVVLRVRRGEHSEAERLIGGELRERVAAKPEHRRLLEGATLFLAQAELAEAADQLNARHWENAEASAQSAIARLVAGVPSHDRLKPEAIRVLRLVAYNRGILRLNHAIALLSSRRFDEALTVVEEVLSGSEDPKLIREAEDVRVKVLARRNR